MSTSPPPNQLAPTEDPVGHEFACTRHYEGDIALLNYLLQDLRVLARRSARGEISLQPQQTTTWEVHGLQRRTVVCDPSALTEGDDLHAVGFFGDRRHVVDQPKIDMSEFNLIDEFRSYPGILSYSSIELVDHYWANLVVHRQPADRESWRNSHIHQRAVEEIAPMAYHAVRIHNGRILGGVCGSKTVMIESTKYWDYDVAPTWTAFRDLPGGETTELAGPIS